MSSSDLYSSVVLVGLILFTGFFGLQLYVNYYLYALTFLEAENIKCFFRDFVNNLELLMPTKYTFSLKYGVLMISIGGFQFLNFANETIFSSYYMVLKYISQYSIYPSKEVIIESGNSTYFSFRIIGYSNQLILYFYPSLCICENKIVVGTPIFKINSPIKIIYGNYIFNPSIVFINRFYSFIDVTPLNLYIHYCNFSYNFVFYAWRSSPLILNCGLILIRISGG